MQAVPQVASLRFIAMRYLVEVSTILMRPFLPAVRNPHRNRTKSANGAGTDVLGLR